ncbi:MAG: hypothetical protein ABUL67_01220 [Haliangium ochraceum]
MRSLVWVSIGLAAALGACSQSLSGNLTGTGGAGAITDTETGSGGKVGTGAAGTSGYNSPSCGAFAAEYEAAMTAARACTPGSKSACTEPVSSSLSVCGSCPAFVTDASKLNAIQQLWQGANCDRPTAIPPCASIGPCPPGVPDVCIAGPDGQGLCSYAGGTGGTTGGSGGRGATGGGSGAGGSPVDGGAADLCNAYVIKYGIVLAAEKTCTFGASEQCAHAVPPSLGACTGGCTTYVNDATELDDLRQLWIQAGCNRPAISCPVISCSAATGAACTQTDAGGGTCADRYVIAL